MKRRTRLAREAAIRQAEGQHALRIRAAAFVAIIVVVLGPGVYLAGADLFGQRGTSRGPDAITVRASMAGFHSSRDRSSRGRAGDDRFLDDRCGASSRGRLAHLHQ